MTPSIPPFLPWLGVFETVRVREGRPLFVEEHRGEMMRAMAALGIEADLDLDVSKRKLPPTSGRWRWVARPGLFETSFVAEPPPERAAATLSLSPVRLGSANWDARFKTVSYLTHAQAAMSALTDEVVLLNEAAHIASGSKSNLFWRRGGQLFTPAHEVGCRRGVVRGFVLKNFTICEGSFRFEDLRAADEIFYTNSMRGVVSISRFEGQPIAATECADKLRAAYVEETAAQVAAG